MPDGSPRRFDGSSLQPPGPSTADHPLPLERPYPIQPLPAGIATAAQSGDLLLELGGLVCPYAVNPQGEHVAQPFGLATGRLVDGLEHGPFLIIQGGGRRGLNLDGRIGLAESLLRAVSLLRVVDD